MLVWHRMHSTGSLISGSPPHWKTTITTQRGAGVGRENSGEKKVRIFASLEEADEADARDDAAMSPEERLNILFELRDSRHPGAAEQRMARVCRITELERS
jgi:hypothetical protein